MKDQEIKQESSATVITQLIMSYVPPRDLEIWRDVDLSHMPYGELHEIQAMAAGAVQQSWADLLMQFYTLHPDVVVPSYSQSLSSGNKSNELMRAYFRSLPIDDVSISSLSSENVFFISQVSSIDYRFRFNQFIRLGNKDIDFEVKANSFINTGIFDANYAVVNIDKPEPEVSNLISWLTCGLVSSDSTALWSAKRAFSFGNINPITCASLFATEDQLYHLAKATDAESRSTALFELRKICASEDQCEYLARTIGVEGSRRISNFTTDLQSKAHAGLSNLTKVNIRLTQNPFTQQEKSTLLKAIQDELREAKTIDDCYGIYKEKINSALINNSVERSLADTVFSFFSGPPKSFKAEFIELVQSEMWKIVTKNLHSSIAFQKLKKYEEMRSSDLFTVDQEGVNPQIKNLLDQKIKELREFLKIKVPNDVSSDNESVEKTERRPLLGSK